MEPAARAATLAEGPRAVMRRFGAMLGAAAQPGDVFALVGGLGAGKTFLSAAIAHGAGVPEGVRISSPTFTIVQQYRGRLPVSHADLYRLQTAADIDDVGLFAHGADALVIVEWADRFPSSVPATALWLELIRIAPLRRRVRAWGSGSRATELIESMLPVAR